MSTRGQVIGINGNMVSVRTDGDVIMNEVGYILLGDKRLKSEVIRIRGDVAQMQVFEITKGIGIGDDVEFSGEMLAVELGPGLLGQVYDGLQNPLPELAEQAGYFLERGIYLDALERDRKWVFTPGWGGKPSVPSPGDPSSTRSWGRSHGGTSTGFSPFGRGGSTPSLMLSWRPRTAGARR